MKIKITLQNSGGELDSRIVETEEAISNAVREIIDEASELWIGDTITIMEIPR